jgi:hypothetical protein
MDYYLESDPDSSDFSDLYVLEYVLDELNLEDQSDDSDLELNVLEEELEELELDKEWAEIEEEEGLELEEEEGLDKTDLGADIDCPPSPPGSLKLTTLNLNAKGYHSVGARV